MNRNTIVRELNAGVDALGQTLPDGAADQMVTLLTELERWGRRINLTAIREVEPQCE